MMILPLLCFAVIGAAASDGSVSARGYGTACTVSTMADLPNCLSSTSILINNLVVPAGKSLDLRRLQTGTTVTFQGTTTFGFANWNGPLLMVSGTNIVIQGGILDGQGAKYWDGLGSNGGVTKPTFFNANLQNSIIRDITLRNTPIQAFAIEGSYIQMINCTVDDLDGMALLNGNPIGHNTDGFNLKGSFMSITDSTVCAQDDCAAIIGGNDFTVTNMKCNCATGGLSVVGEGDDVKNVLFQNIVLVNSMTGAYVRSVVGTTGSISNITYENIHFSSAGEYGIAVQQDYENSGPTGTASNGYEISDIRFSNITGTVGQYGKTIYVICGAGSCKDISLDNVSITGGKGSSCNIAINGC